MGWACNRSYCLSPTTAHEPILTICHLCTLDYIMTEGQVSLLFCLQWYEHSLTAVITKSPHDSSLHLLRRNKQTLPDWTAFAHMPWHCVSVIPSSSLVLQLMISKIIKEQHMSVERSIISQRADGLDCHFSYLQQFSWAAAAWQWSCPACTQSVCGDPFSGWYPETLGS